MKSMKTIMLNLVLILGIITTAGAVYRQNQAEEAYAYNRPPAIVESGPTSASDSDDDSTFNAADSPNPDGPAAGDGNGCGDCSTCGARCSVKQIR